MVIDRDLGSVRSSETPGSCSLEAKTFNRWEECGLRDDLVRGLYKSGMEHPSPVQKATIISLIEGRDLRAQAQSGTGKTAAFTVCILQIYDPELREVQVLVLASTREIATQNANKIKEIGCYMKVEVLLLAGGTRVEEDKAGLSMKRPHIVVGTPGRVYHMISSGSMKTDNIKLFVIDEADEMLKAGFCSQVKDIFYSFEERKESVQVALFSATFGENELNISNDILENPLVIDLRRKDQTLRGIMQYYVNVGMPPQYVGRNEPKYIVRKLEVLMDLYKRYQINQAIVFISRKETVRWAHNWLREREFSCDFISSDLSQEQRTSVLDSFIRGDCRCLISTGLLSRGVDIQSMNVVFNTDIPFSDDRRSEYIHKIGRVGRYGKKGSAVNIVYESEMRDLKALEEHYCTIIEELPENIMF